MICSYRSRISEILKNHIESTSRNVYLNCSKKYFYEWIEFQFDDKMNWDNYRIYWVLDHVIPIAWFNIIDNSHQYYCFSWFNLRPFKKEDNLIKSDKLEMNTIKDHQEIINKWYQNQSELDAKDNTLVIEIYDWLRKELRYGKNPPDNMDNQQPRS